MQLYIFNLCLFKVARLESQVVRYKSAAETAEKVEDELKLEKRKLQREVSGLKCISICDSHYFLYIIYNIIIFYSIKSF